MAEYYNVTTNLGDAEIANAIATNTKLDITHIAFGDGNGAVPTPSKIRTTLLREVHRQAVTKYERHPTNANWIVIETIIPSTVGGFTIREMGVIANGKLISHGSHAPFEKVADPTGVSEYRLKFTQNITDGAVVEITLDESLIYASQAWVEENFIKRSEIIDNLTTDDATKPVSAKQAKFLQDNKLGKTENAVSADKLKNMRSVSFSGGATGSFNFDGSGNSSCILTLANSGVVANTYGSSLKIPTITVNAKGLITGVSEQQISIVDDLTTGGSTKLLSAEQGKLLQDNKLEKTGTAATAKKLEMGRKINKVVFDGSMDIDLPMLGYDQDVVDVTGLRSSGTIYTNGDKPKIVYINVDVVSGSNSEVFFQKNKNGDWIGIGQRGNASRTICAIILPFRQYKYESPSAFSKWVECT